MCKIFADDTSLFSKVLDTYKPVTELNTDVQKIRQWAYQWKMEFNKKKQANEVIFYRKLVWRTRCSRQNYLGVILDPNLNFNTDIDPKIKKCNKMIDLMRDFQ